eukprot:sb/3468830/
MATEVRKRLISQDLSPTSSELPSDLLDGLCEEELNSASDDDSVIGDMEVEKEEVEGYWRELDLGISRQIFDRTSQSELLVVVFKLCEVLFSTVTLVPLTLLIIIQSGDIDRFTNSTNFLLTTLLNLVITIVVKALVARERPTGYPSIVLFSFPSGHASRAGVIIMTVLLTNSTSLLGVVVCGGVVAVSRVGIGKHLVSDVVGGVVIGMLNTVLASATVWCERDTLEGSFGKVQIFQNRVEECFGVLS